MDRYKKSFKTYFRFLNNHVTKYDSLIVNSTKPLSVLSNLTEHLQIILSIEKNNKMLELFPDMKDRLNAKLQLMLEEEVSQLQKIQENMNYCNKELRMRLTQLEQSYNQKPISNESNEETSENDFKQKDLSQDFDPLWPPFSELLEMAVDSWRYYHDFWLNINVSLICIDYEDPEAIMNVKNAFREDKAKKEHICRILLMTKYLVEQE